ncbi:ferredoxin--NADP reductase [Noviherbaspirillum denitrificans]|uniref:ferredoxin--NADP(+) reductase n=1 Tax=Noviherbaspirillum denitrificans TaxID=1968433 RepID=A0A254THF0_9BURK|nr:ferredoxin--NADP reductase [Noviherbaspirillum denitrificans]OWW22034.1 ferredoxin--NADP(+) reductase [Noviherbaspirillum denitrificans]
MLTDPKIAAKATVEKVLRMHWWTDKLLTFTTTRPPGYAFSAGQYARLGLRDANGLVWRAYSMVSSPGQDFLEFYGVLVPNGLFTTQMKALEEGDGILVEKQCYGFMTPDRFPDGEDLWMIATGTGVGPFISMLRDPYVWGKFRRLILVHGARHADEFAYRDELTSYERGAPFDSASRLQVVRAVTREQAAGSDALLLNGRVTTLFENGTLEQAAGLPVSEGTSRIMMCGNPDMIEDMRKLLHARGLRPVRRALPGHFVTENYW